jgi:hypothetical protein
MKFAIDFWADKVEDPERIGGNLAVLRMAFALRKIANHPGCPDLITRLDAQPGQPSQALASALKRGDVSA